MLQPDLGPDFAAYVAGGPADDHEGTAGSRRDRPGAPTACASMMRLGSPGTTSKAQITAVTEKGLDPRNFILCTDDCHSGTLVNDGHMNRVVRHAIDCGCDPLIAIADGDGKHRHPFRAGARAGLDHAGAAGGS